MAYTPDYDKWQQHKKALEKFDKAYKAEVDVLYEKQKGIFKQLNEEQLSALKEEETIEELSIDVAVDNACIWIQAELQFERAE